MITRPSSSVASTMTEGSTLGNRCRHRMLPLEAPTIRVASMKGRRRSDSVSDRTMRANCTQPLSASTRTMLAVVGPNTPMIAIARRMKGKASWTSAARMITASSFPPEYPASSPSATPVVPERSTARLPMSNDNRAPWMMRVSTSLPSWSVPSGWPPPLHSVRPCSRFARSIWLGSWGTIHGAEIAAATTTATTSVPASPVGLRSSASATRPGVVAAAAEPPSSMSAAGSVIADAGIDVGVGDVDQQVDGDEEDRHHQDDRLDERKVAGEDRLGAELADSRPSEHRLGDDG